MCRTPRAASARTGQWAGLTAALALAGCGLSTAPDVPPDNDFNAKYGDMYWFCDRAAGDFPARDKGGVPQYPRLTKASSDEPDAQVALLQKKSDPHRYRLVVYTALYDISTVHVRAPRLGINTNALRSPPPMMIEPTFSTGDDTYSKGYTLPGSKTARPSTLTVKVGVWKDVRKSATSYKPIDSSFGVRLKLRQSCGDGH